MAALMRRGSDSSLPNFWGQSVDSATDEELDLERRGSTAAATTTSGRRGSRLLEFLEKKNKRDRKKYKDKQGFVWRRMIHDHDEDLPNQRAPSLGAGASPWLLSAAPACQADSSIASTPMPSLAPITTLERKISMLSNKSEPPLPRFEAAESGSLTSFKTCPSDPNLTSLVPRQIADNYKLPPMPLPVAVVNAARPIAGKPPPPTLPPGGQPLPALTPGGQPQQVAGGGGPTLPRSVPVHQQQTPPDNNVIGEVRHLVRDR